MLKSIELYGFKSFADRTRMELDGGVCALVGPNGSGKSNVVDAIKWALGEQSAKRLRGDEMTDVIFNGSATRQALGSAEVTLTFDNKSRLLPVESDEIHLTRRVYRNGESEYLINGQGARLKDFRDLVSGVGLGAQGYAVIEQGRVEALLQSSSLQRRAVLEEAAGISRFNAKKQEVLRRLERVEQNLLRLSDLVGEIEGQLRKTKSQAGKAEKYREYSTRLQKLRAEVSLYEWRVKTEARKALSVETDDFAAFEADCTAKIAAADADQTRYADELARADDELRAIESELSGARERIAAEESTIEFQTAQIREWTTEANQDALQAHELRVKRSEETQTATDARAELGVAQEAVARISASYESETSGADEFAARAAALAAERDALQKERETKSGEANRFEGELAGLETRRRSLEATYEQRARQLSEVEREQAALSAEVARIEGDGEQLAAKRQASFERLGELKTRREEARRALAERQVEFSELERKRAAFEERSTLLNDLLRKYDGLSQGVKDTLRAMKDPSSPFRNAYGLVADLIRVNVEAAPLIELALGQTAQYVVVPPEPELFRHIERQGARFAGRVGFIWLDPNPGKPIPLDERLSERRGVLGRADQFVETEPMFAALMERLLHRTWIVESVAVAKQLYREVEEPTNFLAADGSLLTADGTLVVGAAQGGAGLISRRSELAALSEETARLERDFSELGVTVGALKEELTRLDAEFDAEATSQRETVQSLETLRLQGAATRERDAQLVARVAQLGKETGELRKELDRVTQELEGKRRAKEEFEATRADLDARIAASQAELDAADAARAEKTKNATNLKIELAKAEERIVFLTERIKRFEDAQGERERRIAEYETRAQTLLDRARAAELAALASESTIASLYALKERLSARAQTSGGRRAELETGRARAAKELRQNRDALEKRREQIRSKELSCERYAQEIISIEERMKEDYGLELASLEYVLEGEQTVVDERALVAPTTEKSAKARRREIEELRAKLRDLGSVNLEAIEALETLKTRYATLFNQYNDLIAARKSIQKILERVNADCKRLFEETLKAVRENFSAIFQKLFGGGKADLTLEEPSKPLESGVEIVARPPGKELKSLTLLSGGEKSLTCVALLLAIFQYRTSPLCVLDEVDAALDEANVHRFANALQDFIPTTQFLLVTHSKKTMSCSKAIYGVTMEDSGVSKILSVQFDDVGEDGEILVKGKSSTLKLSGTN